MVSRLSLGGFIGFFSGKKSATFVAQVSLVPLMSSLLRIFSMS